MVCEFSDITGDITNDGVLDHKILMDIQQPECIL